MGKYKSLRFLWSFFPMVEGMRYSSNFAQKKKHLWLKTRQKNHRTSNHKK